MYMDIIESLFCGAIATAVLAGFVYLVVKTQQGKIALVAIIGFLALVAASGCLAEEAKEVQFKTGTVENTKPVCYKDSLCYETYVNVDGNVYVYYDTNCWYNGTRLNLAFTDDEIINAEKVITWWEIAMCFIVPIGIISIVVYLVKEFKKL